MNKRSENGSPPLVGKDGAGIPQAARKIVENQRPNLESER
jgi:hypothetical protein